MAKSLFTTLAVLWHNDAWEDKLHCHRSPACADSKPVFNKYNDLQMLTHRTTAPRQKMCQTLALPLPLAFDCDADCASSLLAEQRLPQNMNEV